jgi:hypothetical protein
VFCAEEHVPPKTRCREAAIAVINHLAGVYDEAMKNEPPDAD